MYENNNGYYQPGADSAPYNSVEKTANNYVEEAFSKSLAATIMSCFPVASIIAIIFGCKGLSLLAEAKRIAALHNIRLSGKNIAAMVLGKIGKIAGIVMTVFWGIYFLLIFALIAASI